MIMAASLQPEASGALSESRFTVPAIRCAGCIAKIERGLSKVPGVATARVNFSAKWVSVQHNGLDDEMVLDALRKIGFEAHAAADWAAERENQDTDGLLRALAVAGFGMMNIMLLSVSVWSGAGDVTRDMFHWLSALIALPVIAYAGRPFFASAAAALRCRRSNMDVPISIGVLLATGMSFYETLSGGAHAYFDSAVMLLFFLLAGRFLDATMRDRTRAGIGALLGNMGKSASILQPDGSTRRTATVDLEPGMVMLVAAGEALAADGEILAGTGAVDNATLTGESVPVSVAPGDMVHAGAINLTAPLRIRIDATHDDTVLSEISRLMDEAGQSRGRYVRIADRAARLYAPAVHSLALAAFLGWTVAGADWHYALIIAISVLIITCPCAMGLAVPAAQVVASGALGKRGVLIKDGSALERLAEVDMVVFDKTGTLTLGAPLADVSGLDDSERAAALALAQTSRHPLSRGLAASLVAEGVIPAEIGEIHEEAGRGIVGVWKGQEIALEKSDKPTAGLQSILRIANEQKPISFTDPLRRDVTHTIDTLANLGLPARILSGDRRENVAAVAKGLGIDGQGGATPAEKLAAIEELKRSGLHPLMVGDGLNDGPSLAAAHASLAPASASDASQQAADAVFLGESLMPVALTVRVARETMRIVRQNFRFSVAYNVFAVPLALAGQVTPLVAAIAMSLSSLVVVGNSLRIARAGR